MAVDWKSKTDYRENKIEPSIHKCKNCDLERIDNKRAKLFIKTVL